MQCMVTITHNDHVPELLAVIRRNPFAEPTETEMVEYLFTRVRTDRRKADFENFAFEHVLSYQRRIAATKEHFMRRNKLTPLGIIQDWWELRRVKEILGPAGLVFSTVTMPHQQDRTEAQMRAALHDSRRDKLQLPCLSALSQLVRVVVFSPSRGPYTMLASSAAVPERL